MNTSRNRFRTRRVQALLATAALVAGMGLFATTASATTLTASVGGVPSGTNYENFDWLALGSGGGTNGIITVSFSPDGQAVKGSLSGVYAAPVLSNNNGTLFGDPNNGLDSTTYLTAGGTATSSATLTFSSPQMYLGLLWGSVDSYNQIEFFLGGSSITTFGGGAVSAAAGAGNCVNGNQTSVGTCYVNINLSSPFDKVVMTSTEHAFEFDNVAYSARPIGVPEPGVWNMFLLGLALVGSGYWLRGRKLA